VAAVGAAGGFAAAGYGVAIYAVSPLQGPFLFWLFVELVLQLFFVSSTFPSIKNSILRTWK
jgi:hypothetical protein